MIKLNLGSGSKILPGYTNVDKFDTYNPDIVHDLEKFPYPFKDSSFNVIYANQVLEHLEAPLDRILSELCRICKESLWKSRRSLLQ